jgi:competence protein ComEA
MADLLKGVGLKKAQAIVDYRTEYGAFSAPEDLLNVSGIGPSTLEKNRLIIRIGESE